MAELAFFGTAEEACSILLDFAVRRGLSMCTWTSYREIVGLDTPGALADALGGGVWGGNEARMRCFLVPRAQLEGLARSDEPPVPRMQGWIHVSIGELDAGVLTMSILSAEDHPGLGFSPCYWLRKLRADLVKNKTLQFGATGHAGGWAYPEIGYTADALALYSSGTLWKQHCTDNGGFLPLATEGSELPPAQKAS